MAGLNFTYVDNSNIKIEGQRISAVKKGMPGATDIFSAMNNKVVDHGWKLDYGRLHQLVCGTRTQIGCANLWGSPPPGDSFWEMVRHKGFSYIKYEKNFSGKEKKVDVAIAHQITKDVYSGKIDKNDEVTLVSGDNDFVPVVADLKAEGYNIILAFWGHAGPEIRRECSQFF